MSSDFWLFHGFIDLIIHEKIQYLFWFQNLIMQAVFGTGALFVVLNQAPNLKMLGLLQVLLEDLTVHFKA